MTHENESCAPIKLLVVDDYEENRTMLEALLEGEGIEVLLASSAEEAMDLLRIHDVCVALLDVHMPDMDGYQLATIMRAAERARRIPILFLTAGASDRSEEFRVPDAGTVEFLLKPIHPRELRQKVGGFVQECRKQRPAEKQERPASPSGEESTPAGVFDFELQAW